MEAGCCCLFFLPFPTATQDVVDPRRLGQQNSGFSDDEIADIICILYPTSENARRAVVALERDNPKHLISQPPDSGFNVKYLLNDDPARFSLATPVSAQHAIVLRLSVDTKDPAQGFTFGRNPSRCDICFANDPLKRLSNIHFRIYINEYGVLMLEDTSTNGTVVDERMLQKAKAKADRSETKRTLSNGSEIKIMLHSPSYDIVFLVQVPKREGRHEEAFRQNLYQYRQRAQALDDDRTQTIVPGNNGPVSEVEPRNRACYKAVLLARSLTDVPPPPLSAKPVSQALSSPKSAPTAQGPVRKWDNADRNCRRAAFAGVEWVRPVQSYWPDRQRCLRHRLQGHVQVRREALRCKRARQAPVYQEWRAGPEGGE